LNRALDDAKAENAELEEGDEFPTVVEKKPKKTRKPRAKKDVTDKPAPKKRGRPRKKKEPTAQAPSEETPKED